MTFVRAELFRQGRDGQCVRRMPRQESMVPEGVFDRQLKRENTMKVPQRWTENGQIAPRSICKSHLQRHKMAVTVCSMNYKWTEIILCPTASFTRAKFTGQTQKVRNYRNEHFLF